MDEVWKNITIADNHYEISLSGLVRNTINGKVHKGSISSCGYPSVSLQKNGKNKSFLLHRLLLETFVGPCPLGMEGRHLDGNRLNHSLDNLKWGTRSENRRDRTKHGREVKGFHACPGEYNWHAKLTDEKVLEIDFLLSRGVQPKELAPKYGVSKRTIWLIGIHKTWFHLWSKPSIVGPYDPLEGISE